MRSLLSGVVLIFMLPRVALQCLVAMYRQQKISIYLSEYAGLGMRKIQHRTLMVKNKPLSDLDSWLHYLKGNLDLIGPERLAFNQAQLLNSLERSRFSVAPGMISPYKIKRASGIAHRTERDIAVEFASNASRLRRIQLTVIYLIQSLFGSARTDLETPETFNLFGVTLNNVSMSNAVKTVVSSLTKEHGLTSVSKFAFVNADCGNHLYKDHNYKEILNGFKQVYPDGIGVKMAARMQGCALKENINGTDMFPLLCEELQSAGKSLYLYGATDTVIRKLVDKLDFDYPELKVAGYSDGYSYSNKPTELHARINNSGADLLLVAMGAPRQERWINDNISLLNVKAVMGVGGLFDFHSGEVSRAPIWLRELSLEWVWRVIQQPKDKFKRYVLGNPLFLARALHLSLSHDRFEPLAGAQS